jgi:hypothetical protein
MEVKKPKKEPVQNQKEKKDKKVKNAKKADPKKAAMDALKLLNNSTKTKSGKQLSGVTYEKTSKQVVVNGTTKTKVVYERHEEIPLIIQEKTMKLSGKCVPLK